MPIISENQQVKAGIELSSGLLHVDFVDDPSFIRSETVLVDLMHRSIGIIFQNAYHHIGDLPKNVIGKDIEKLTRARLKGHGAGGRELQLHAPVKFVSTTKM